jgi:predicted regulator of Ras-like GTPase activity (Roadblock/LC7/MglB family)
MRKTQSKSKLEKISTQDVEIDLEDLKSKESKSQAVSLKTKVREVTPERIRAVLDEMRTKDGTVVGYILRNTKSASVDLNDPAKIIDFASLSSAAKETGEELSQTFGLGETEHVLIDGKNTKLIAFTVGENDICVFMEKQADHDKILKTLSNIT